MNPALHWITAVAALVGVWLNIKKHVACFWIWTGTNAAWAYVDLVHGIYAQSVLHVIYVALAVYGITQWRERSSDEHKNSS